MNQRKALIDVHAHIIPGVDDGARSLEEACRMLRAAIAQGVTSVIATPHYSRHREMPGLREKAQALQDEIQKEYSDFTIYLGQETYYHEELPERLKAGTALTMAGSRYVMVEFEPSVSYEYLFRGIRSLLHAGYIPLLAHVERYFCVYREERFLELAGSGCLFQMNYESLGRGWPGKQVRWCRRQVASGRIAMLGTDMHRMDFRPPELSKAMSWLKRHIDGGLLSEMTAWNPLRMIKDERIE